MKLLLFVLAFLAFSPAANAHEYFFAFAELEYRHDTKRFEITLEGSAHDVEDVLNESGIAIKELEDHYDDVVMKAKIEAFINKGFVLSADGKSTRLKLEAMEVQSNGLVHFYLVSEEIVVTSSLDVQFDWLMDVLPKQQNKITVLFNNQKYTAVFLPHQHTATIQFDTK